MRLPPRPMAAVMAGLLAFPAPAQAHNEAVHQRMTDYAYHVLLAGARFSDGSLMSDRLRIALQNLAARNPAATTFFADAARAVPRLKDLRSGLPEDPAPCTHAMLVATYGGGAPQLNLPPDTTLARLPMGKVPMPITIHYGTGGSVCAIYEAWNPSGVLAAVNPGTYTTRDHTGLTLGHWAAAPDRQVKDWVLSSTTLLTLQNPVVVGGIGAGVTVAVAVLCGLACGLLPILCLLCPFLAVGAGGAVIDEITSIDADSLEHKDFVGLGHFVDMKPTPPGTTFFDVKPAKFPLRAGPGGAPDLVEQLTMALYELAGIHVNHAESDAPKHYEILGPGPNGADFHPNTTHRDAVAWESPTLTHQQFTPVDNLGMFGYGQAKGLRGTEDEASRLGWPLHALGDASVPMHAVGASGFGHRPYEDSVDAVYDELVGSADLGRSIDTVIQVLSRALKWRKLVQDWRALHGTKEVPVRDLVTALAETARQKADAQPAVYKPLGSLQYLVDEDAAIASYDNSSMAAVQRDLLIEGIAAEVAFLLSYTEVAP
jgi:hypothetical protein